MYFNYNKNDSKKMFVSQKFTQDINNLIDEIS